MLRCNHDLVRSRVQPSPPPGKRAVGNNVMVTGRHEPHILMGAKVIIVLNEDCPEVAWQVFFNKRHIVRKYKKSRIYESFLESGDGVEIVLKRQSDPTGRGNSAVTPAHMERDSVPALANLVQ